MTTTTGGAPVVLALDEVDAAGPLPQLRRALKRLAAIGREAGQENDMATTEAPAVMTADHRNRILGYASDMLPLRGRQPDAVLATAAPLLGWAGQAVTKYDLNARMAALRHAHCNSLFRHPVPQDFLDEAGLYHAFITGVSA